jgi:hypothetical protein
MKRYGIGIPFLKQALGYEARGHRKGFVELPEHWKYSSARNWILGDDRIIEIDRDIL